MNAWSIKKIIECGEKYYLWSSVKLSGEHECWAWTEANGRYEYRYLHS